MSEFKYCNECNKKTYHDVSDNCVNCFLAQDI